MSIIKRIKELFKANINASLDKYEDPEKMIDQAIRDMTDVVGNAKKQTAKVIATGYSLDRRIQAQEKEIEELNILIARAKEAGETDDVTLLSEERDLKEAELQEILSAKRLVDEKATELVNMDKVLSRKYSQSLIKRDVIRTKCAVAKAKEVTDKSVANTLNATTSYVSSLARAEEKINNTLDLLNAQEAVEKISSNSSIEGLKAKYAEKSTKYLEAASQS